MSTSHKQGLDSHVFLAKLLTQYALIHEKTLGSAAQEYIRQLGLRTGEWIEGFYGDRNEVWTIDKYANVIVDLKNKINGQFEIDSIHSDHVVVKATQCPFGELVKDSPNLCSMTSSVFGGIASRRFGYGKVDLRQRIAKGDPICEVAVYFNEDEAQPGEEYKDLPVTPDQGDPFKWEEETIQMLGEELRKSDEMIESLVAELAELRAQVNKS